MKVICIIIASLWVAVAGAQTLDDFRTSDDALADSTGQSTGLRKELSDKPFFGTQNILTLNGDYINSPREDFEQTGKYTLPLSLDELHGVVTELSFGDGKKQGAWQLSYRYRLMAADSEWQAIANRSSLTLSDRRTQVLKASYNVRDWWKFGVSALVEDRYGTDSTLNNAPLDLNNRQGLGFQIDTSLKF